MKNKKIIKGDVFWYSKKFKYPIAYSTVATSEVLCTIAEEMKEREIPTTPNNILEFIKSKFYVCLTSEINVMQTYIDKGCGNEILNIK